MLYDWIPGHCFKLIYVTWAFSSFTCHSTNRYGNCIYFLIYLLSLPLGKDIFSFIPRSIPGMLPDTLETLNSTYE